MRGGLLGGRLAIAGVCAALAATIPARAGEGFLTHLSLLDRLTREAVDEMLVQLTVPAGEEVYVLPSGSHEGNSFVADILVDQLVRNGCKVRLLDPAAAPAAPPAEETGAGQTKAPPPFPPGRGPFEPDSSAVSPDSTGWDAVPSDSSMTGASQPGAAGGPAQDTAGVTGGVTDTTGAASGAHADSSGATARGRASAQPLPPTRRLYPEGRILEFRVLEFGVQYPSVKRRYFLMGPAVVRRIGGVYVQGSWVHGPDGTILGVGSGQSHHYDVLSGRSVSFAEGASYPFQKPTVQPLHLGRFVEPVAVVGIITSLVYLFYQNQN